MRAMMILAAVMVSVTAVVAGGTGAMAQSGSVFRAGDADRSCMRIVAEADALAALLGEVPGRGVFSSDQAIILSRQAERLSGQDRADGDGAAPIVETDEAKRTAAWHRLSYLSGLYVGRACDEIAAGLQPQRILPPTAPSAD